MRYNGKSRIHWAVRHYHVHFNALRGVYFIFNREKFPTVESLIFFYSCSQNRLVWCPTQPLTNEFPPARSINDLQVARSSFTRIQLLIRGVYGSVWTASWNGKIKVVLKTSLPDTKANCHNARRFICEAELIFKMNHPRVIRLLAVCTQPLGTPVHLVIEFMEKGLLTHYMQTLKPTAVKYDVLLKMMLQVVEAMTYLEQENVVLRNLRAATIMVDHKGSLKIFNFELAHQLSDGVLEYTATDANVSIRRLSPESLKSKTFSSKSDVWSYGVLLHEILTFCELPYKGMKWFEVCVSVSQGYQLPRPLIKMKFPSSFDHDKSEDGHQEYGLRIKTECGRPLCPKRLYNIMLACWEFKPQNRPSFAQLLQIITQLQSQKSNHGRESDDDNATNSVQPT